MRIRKSARILVLNPRGEVLLFKFSHATGALAGQTYWATPGGAVEDGETLPEAASRELYEETGIKNLTLTAMDTTRVFPMQLNDGEWVQAQEYYFIALADGDVTISEQNWSENEQNEFARYAWLSQEFINTTEDVVYPQGLAAMIAGVRDLYLNL